MWILWVLVFVAAFFLIAGFISRLPGETYPGLKKLVTDERPDTVNHVRTDTTLERLSGDTQPFFDTVLLLEEKSPEQLLATWRLDQQMYDGKLADYHQEHVDHGKALLRLSYTGGKRAYEDYPVRLADKALEILINAPGATVKAELGFYTKERVFVPIATSNDVIIPK